MSAPTHALVRVEACCLHFRAVLVAGTETECLMVKAAAEPVDGDDLLVVPLGDLSDD